MVDPEHDPELYAQGLQLLRDALAMAIKKYRRIRRILQEKGHDIPPLKPRRSKNQ